MKLTQRIHLLLRTAWNDLFGEEQQGETLQAAASDMTAARLNGLLDDAQQQLDVLRLELANAVNRQKRIARAWQDALAQTGALNATVDEALKAGQDEQARAAQEQANLAQKQAAELAELARVCEQHSAEIRAAVGSQQERLDALRRRALLLEDRENSLAMLTELLGAQQSLAHQTDTLQNEFAEWEEQIARREDRLAARREWSK